MHMEHNKNILCLDSPAIHPADRVFRLLEGGWDFSRRIPAYGRMIGAASFTRTDETRFLYRENGLLKLEDGPVFESFRNYIYEFSQGRITVFFEDGRFFHTLDFESESRARGIHECGFDLYRGYYEFGDQDRFRLEWAVTGPKKDYTICTDFKRRVS
jgi:hypothetical protein